MAPQQSPFLALPGELRNQIYREYLLLGAEGGYVHDYEAGKLRTVDMQPIDLNLMYTCRLIAHEMRGLALRLHKVTFSTVYSEELRSGAGAWNTIIYYNTMWLQLDDCVPLMTQEMMEEVSRRYGATQSYSTLCRMRARQIDRELTRGCTSRWDGQRSCDGIHQFGEPPSVFRDMARDVLQLAATDTTIRQTLDCRASGNTLADDLLNAGWTREYYEDDGFLYRFSAAAAAIRFLNMNPGVRKHLRKIVLREDHVAMAYPECHARGLAPFCQENPALRIERRVDLWHNLFLPCIRESLSISQDPDFIARELHIHNDRSVRADEITRVVATWMAEAALPDVPDAITLVLDGDPVPEHTAKIFREVVQRDAAWQTALDRTVTLEAGAQPDDVFYKRASLPFHCVGFPELLRDVCSGRKGCRISCNFDPGCPWDDERVSGIAEANGGHAAGVVGWNQAWARPEVGYGTVSPLPELPGLAKDLMTDEYYTNEYMRDETDYYAQF